MSNKKKMALTITPEKILYFKSPYFHPVKVKMTLANGTTECIAYKVKCIDTMHYAVKPAVGSIAPGQTQAVIVALLPLSGPSRKPDVVLFERDKQLFAVVAAKVTEGGQSSASSSTAENALATAKRVLKRAEERGQLMETILKCTFDDAQLAAALEESTKSAVPSIRTNPVDRSVFNGPSNEPVLSDSAELITEEDKMTVLYIIAGLVAILAIFYAVYYACLH